MLQVTSERLFVSKRSLVPVRSVFNLFLISLVCLADRENENAYDAGKICGNVDALVPVMLRVVAFCASDASGWE